MLSHNREDQSGLADQSGMFEASPFQGCLISPSCQVSSASLFRKPCPQSSSTTFFMTHLVHPLAPSSFSAPRRRRFEYQDVDFIPRRPEGSSTSGPCWCTRRMYSRICVVDPRVPHRPSPVAHTVHEPRSAASITISTLLFDLQPPTASSISRLTLVVCCKKWLFSMIRSAS